MLVAALLFDDLTPLDVAPAKAGPAPAASAVSATSLEIVCMASFTFVGRRCSRRTGRRGPSVVSPLSGRFHN